MRKILLFALVLTLTLSFATSQALTAKPKEVGLQDAGNKFCPVSGDKVSGKHFVEYQGKRYGLCCKMCASKFNKDPQKFLAQMAEQQANPSAAHANPEHMH